MEQEVSKDERRGACRFLAITSILYLIFSPIIFILFYLFLWLFTVNSQSFFIRTTIEFLLICIPLSVPISIFFMWLRYFQKQYTKAYFHTGVPIVIGIVNYLIAAFLNELN